MSTLKEIIARFSDYCVDDMKSWHFSEAAGEPFRMLVALEQREAEILAELMSVPRLQTDRPILRSPQPAPTAPGWYYARPVNGPREPIEPMFVDVDDSDVTRLHALDSGRVVPLDSQTWFGPVPKIVEAEP